jgi:hypothetical protein
LQQYLNQGKTVHLIGINFSSAKKAVEAIGWETLKTSLLKNQVFADGI